MFVLSQIRAKEALKQQADMLRDEDLDNQLQMLDRLPDMIKILRSYPLPQNKLFQMIFACQLQLQAELTKPKDFFA